MTRVWAVAMALVTVACADTIVSGEDFARSCEQSSACVLVLVGDVCAACLTTFVAINEDDFDRYREEIEANNELCAPWSERYHVECVVPVPASRPVCVDGVCVSEGGGDCTFEDRPCRLVD